MRGLEFMKPKRLACFALDKDSGSKLIFNRTIMLKDTWTKEAQKK
jgi:hypothetical protein